MAIEQARDAVFVDTETGQAAILKGGVDGVELDENGKLVITVNGITTLCDEIDRTDLDQSMNVAATPKAVADAISYVKSNLPEFVNDLDEESLTQLVNKIISETGGLTVDENGQIVVDFSKMDAEIIQNVVNAMVQEGGGLSVDENGQLYVDFASMPTDKFEAMLKSIRVPIWLEKNTNFYVNGSTGSDDTSDDDRGLSEDKPFKTIQACIDYVTDTYNLSTYNAVIRIAPGTYNETLRLPDYSTTSGACYIRPLDEDAVGQVVITATDTTAVRVQGGIWYLYDLDITVTATISGVSSLSYVYGIGASQSAQAYVAGIHMTFDMSGDFSSDGRVGRCYSAETAAQITFAESSYRGFEITSTANDTANLTGIFGSTKTGYVMNTSDNETAAETLTCKVSGAFMTFLSLQDNASLSRIISRTYDFAFSGDGVTGKRYALTAGAWCNTRGGGSDFFPGDEDGTVEASTYSWYN